MVDGSEIMPFGMHRGLPLKDVPADYLLRLHKKMKKEKSWGRMVVVIQYVEENWKDLYKKYQKQKAEYQKQHGIEAEEALKYELEKRKGDWEQRNKFLGKRI